MISSGLLLAIDWFNPAVIAAWITFVVAIAALVLPQYVERKYERESVNRAVLAEILRLLRVIELAENFWRKRVEARDTGHPIISFSHLVYSKQVRNIGVLNASFVARAVQFYGYIDFLNELIASRPEYINIGKSADFDEIYLAGLRNCIRDFGHAFDEQFRIMKVN